MLTVIRYNQDRAAEWDAFVAGAKNSTFLLMRGYMDYHSDRFTDCSLMIYKHKDEVSINATLVALLPATIHGDELRSHGGLTYGGLIMNADMTAELCLDVFAAINSFLRNECGVNRVVYKPTPWIYHTMPAEEDLYAIVKVCKAQILGREVSSTICLDNPLKFTKQRHRGVNKARRNGIRVEESNDIKAFWHILDNNLMAKYGVHPVHTIAELELLCSRFPDNIRLFMAYLGDEALGGTLVFECGRVVHTQYISASPRGKELGALDLVFSWLINERYAEKPYLDFGKSTEDKGSYLNSNLIHQKEGFGGRGVCYDIYEWTIE